MPATTIGQFLVAQAWQFVLLLCLLAAGAFFSGAETALFGLSRGELFALGHDPRGVARLVPALMRRPGNVLTTVLLGTNVAHIVYFVLSTLLALRIGGEVRDGAFWAWVLSGLALLAMVIVGEVLPKTLAYVWARPVAPAVAPVLAVLGEFIRPVRRVLMGLIVDPLTRVLAPVGGRRSDLAAEEMSALLGLSQKRGLIGQDQTELLQEVLELTDLRAGDIMVPRVDMVAYDVDAPAEGLREIVREKRITKIPVYEGNPDRVVGVVYAKHLLVQPGVPLRQIASPVQFVPESAPLERVLMQFRATRSPLGIVVDEYGGTAGLVTLEDVLEEIVGDIADAREKRTFPVQQVGPTEWLVDGDLPIHEWAEAFPTDLAGARFATVGGFVTSLLGHIPRIGEQASYRNVTFVVEAMGRRRVSLLRVRLKESPS